MRNKRVQSSTLHHLPGPSPHCSLLLLSSCGTFLRSLYCARILCDLGHFFPYLLVTVTRSTTLILCVTYIEPRLCCHFEYPFETEKAPGGHFSTGYTRFRRLPTSEGAAVFQSLCVQENDREYTGCSTTGRQKHRKSPRLTREGGLFCPKCDSPRLVQIFNFPQYFGPFFYFLGRVANSTTEITV